MATQDPTWVAQGEGCCRGADGLPVYASRRGIPITEQEHGIRYGDSRKLISWCQMESERRNSKYFIVDRGFRYYCYPLSESPCDVAKTAELGRFGGSDWLEYSLVEPPTATAVGDPHCANAKGDKFDINILARRLPMVVWPFNSSVEEASFAIFVDTIPNVWDGCAPPFISKIEVQSTDCGFAITLGDSWVPQISKASSWDTGDCHEKFSFNITENKVFVTSALKDLKMKIDQLQTKFKNQTFRFFNMEVSSKELAVAGGILGSGPHEWASSKAAICARASRDATQGADGSFAKAVFDAVG